MIITKFASRISLNELSTILQKYERTVEHPYMHAEIEDSIIRARAKVLDCERRYVVIPELFFNTAYIHYIPMDFYVIKVLSLS